VYVETAGPEDAATTVLLLHGFPDSHKLWQAQVTADSCIAVAELLLFLMYCISAGLRCDTL
jgi:pimeloyl-ACP methyl ester carboxylesterase